MQSEIQSNQFQKEEEFKIQEVLAEYLLNWKWYILSLIISITLGVLYLRYTPFQYEASATILVKSDSKGGGSELSAFEDLGIFSSKSNLDNEIEVLKSRALISLVVQELDLNIAYIDENGPVPVRYFQYKPIHVHFSDGDASIYEKTGDLEIKILSNESYQLTDNKKIHKEAYKFGNEIQTSLGKITITPNFTKENPELGIVSVIVTPIDKVISGYIGGLNISKINKESDVIKISLVGSNIDLSVAFINSLIKQHGIDAIEDKNQISKNTTSFIDQRMKLIAAELSDVEGDVESFKTENRLVDVVSEAGLFLEASSENNNRILENEIQIRLSDFVYEYLISHKDATELIPSNLGLSNPAIERMIDSYNQLILEKNRLLKNSTEKNPVILNLDVQIMGIHKSLKESLSNLKQSIQIQNKELRKTEKLINSKIQSVPKYEREYREIQRQQQIKETLYLYLLQKREETAIALAATVGNTKIIDQAFSNGKPVSPKSRIIYLATFIIALLIPTAVIYIKNLMDTKVRSKNDITDAGLPYMGDIPLTDNKDKIVVKYGSNDIISESFRLLRTNVDFLLKSKPDSKHTIFITSTIPKEGKSFVSVNLASILALSNNKVLLMGMDLRKPKVAEYMDIPDGKGVTNFITDPTLDLKDVIIKRNLKHNFDILLAGNIPPNPAELLMHPKVAEIFKTVQAEYDYIIVDTAPVGAVTDTLLINEFADTTIYISRANYLDKRFLTIPYTLMEEKKLTNVSVLINGSETHKGYGYGYGYGYDYAVETKKKPWWKF